MQTAGFELAHERRVAVGTERMAVTEAVASQALAHDTATHALADGSCHWLHWAEMPYAPARRTRGTCAAAEPSPTEATRR